MFGRQVLDVTLMDDWHLKSWQDKPRQQTVNYPSNDEVLTVVEKLRQLPPLTTALEIEALKQQLASAAKGKHFLLQGGDCAERFSDCEAIVIKNKLKILLQMSLVLLNGLQKPIIRVGRIAGQYAKPRSTFTETQKGITLPSYRGDLVNSPEFNQTSRTPDPQRMLQGYRCAAMTLNYIRALIDGGFANLQNPKNWDLDFAKDTPLANEFHHIAASFTHSLNFMESISGLHTDAIERVQFYTSHEALCLPYETALTHCEENGKWYNLSTHFPWIGMRTADPNDAHVEYFRGIANPIAVKIGPDISKDTFCQLVDILNPDNELGRLTMIHRLGAEKTAQLLPQLIQWANESGYEILWSCDPMHGNTATTELGVKTRYFDHILHELTLSSHIHKEMGSHLGGVHFELTGENVTECIGGTRGVQEGDLDRAYKSLVDPRLNYEQALEMALMIVRHFN